jgi:predicted PurR-regulated permease PerM
MWIFGFPYAPMISTLIGVTALVPVIGAFAGGGIGAFMILTVDPMQALFFIIYLLALQQLEENLIYPRVMGSHVNLPGMWVLAAITVGGGVAGPVGMLIGVPLASTVYTLFREATAKREAKASARVTPEAEVETVPETPIERDESTDAVDSVAEGTPTRDADGAVNRAPTQSAASRKNKKKRRK